MSDHTAAEPSMEDLRRLIRTIPDYPKPGIQFRDITTLLEDAAGLRRTVDAMSAFYRDAGVVKVAGIEARGFILGGAIAVALGAGFVALRKRGKLPSATVGQDYALEYGTDRIEVHVGAVAAGERVLLIDDLIATGGTAEAAARLLRGQGATVEDACFIVDLPELGGARRLDALGIRARALVAFEGH